MLPFLASHPLPRYAFGCVNAVIEAFPGRTGRVLMILIAGHTHHVRQQG
jgi:hypothetical protein